MKDTDFLGQTIGHVRIVDLLGQGGMGSVYVGYDEKLDRKVALKAIRDEHRLDPTAKTRFSREARVLSQLDHPNICRIHDYVEGADADFLILELIAGRNLKEVIREGNAPMALKFRIAEQLLEVLAATHAAGVIHRDIKPANIMLTESKVVKVLDFGLARSSEKELQSTLSTVGFDGSIPPSEPPGVLDKASSYCATRLGTIVGTLAYMSPEQARGEFVTPASDMYSCGLVLQELFTGRHPFNIVLTPEQLLLRAREAESAPVSGLDPQLTELITRLKSPSPGARPSAADALEKLRRIEATPRRVRRRVAFVAGFICLSLLCAALTVQSCRAAREEARAKQEAETSKQISDFLIALFKVSDPGEARGNTVTARELLDKGAEEIQRELKDQPEVQAELMDVIGAVYWKLGLYMQAQPLLEAALKTREKTLGPDDPTVCISLNNLATLYSEQGKYAEALPLQQRSLEMMEKALGPDHPGVATSLNNLATLYSEQGKYAEAVPLLQRSLQIQEEAVGPDHLDVSLSLHNLASVYQQQGKYAEAEPLLQRSIQIQEKALAPDHPDLAVSLNNLASLYSNQGKYTEAESLLQRSLQIQETALGLDHREVGKSLFSLAALYWVQRRYAEAEPLFQWSLKIQEKALGPDHPDVAQCLYSLAVLNAHRGNRAEAIEFLRRALPGGGDMMRSIATDPGLVSLHGDPEFERIVAEVNKRAATKPIAK